MGGRNTGSGRVPAWIRDLWTLFGTWVLVNGLLLVPWWIAGGQAGRAWIALEASLLVGLAALLPRGRGSRWIARTGGLAAGLAGLLVLADAATRQSLARPLNLYLDIHLAPSVLHLLQGTFGRWSGAGLLLTGMALWVGLTLLSARLLSRLTGSVPAGLRPLTAWVRPVLGALLLTGSAAALAGHPLPVFGLGQGWAERPAWIVVDQQRTTLSRMLRTRDGFQAEMAASPTPPAPPELLARLAGRDVVLGFVESYGTTALDDPRYGPVVRPRLEAMEPRLQAAGLSMATGLMIAPSQGGQSWLGHASLLSGLWISDQLRYDLLVASERATLVDDFRRAGFRTAAIMPAITRPWPEGRRFGYDRIHTGLDMNYRGPALNWVTMPDQYTWSFLGHEVLEAWDGPVFAELGLISSHAPWTPILTVLEDWSTVGDGSVFSPWEGAGEPPEVLWRDAERVREHFAMSVEYALHAALSWAESQLPAGSLLILSGDHQPAPLITGDGAPRTVPVHVISNDPALLEPFIQWGFTPGLLPGEATATHRMDAFRPWFLDRFSGTPGAAGG